jgi:hypothetical protein
MNDLLDRVASLETWADTQERRARRGLIWSCWAYGLLVVFVAGYTLVIVPILKEFTTPSALGEQAHAWLLTELPAQRGALVGYCLDNSPVWAQSGVELVKSAVPAVEDRVTAALDVYSGKLADTVKVKLGPALTEAVTARTPELKSRYEELKQANRGQEIPGTLAALLGEEMDRYLTDEFVLAADQLQSQLELLANRPESQLSRREEAQRRALSAWTVLSERGELGEGVLDDLMGKANQLFIRYFSKEDPSTDASAESARAPGRAAPATKDSKPDGGN